MCDSAQYIAEIMCRRRAIKDGNNLAFKFWNKTQKTAYQAQIVAARKLIKEFGEKAVLSYLNKNERIYSLGHYTPLGFVKEGISIEKQRLDLSKPDISETIEVREPINLTPQKQFTSGGSLLSRIKKADKTNG
jgi:hypothetical protein